jgi:hypothetical protein
VFKDGKIGAFIVIVFVLKFEGFVAGLEKFQGGLDVDQDGLVVDAAAGLFDFLI